MLAERLGSYLAATGFADLPPTVVEKAKVRVLDLLGAAMAGYRLGLYRPLLSVLPTASGNSRVWGEGTSAPAATAATVNSFMAHCTYLEDGSRTTGGHPSSAVIPAVLALAEALGAPGDKVILGIVLGYEVFIRIGKAIYPSTVARGFQPTAILAALGAAAGCARLLDLDARGCAHALAIGANLGAGLKEALKASASQPVQVGRSCEGGLTAALLAKQDLEGYPLILEAFLRAHAEEVRANDILAQLGEAFEIEQTYLKVHGGCRGNHAPLDVVLKLVRENRLQAAQIERIVIGIDSVTAAAEIHRPQNGQEAQFSIPFSVAAALVYGDASLFQYTDERVQDPEIRAVMERIRVEISPEMDRLLPQKRGARAEILSRDGRRFRGVIDVARGEPEAPFAQEEIEEKFNLLAGDVLKDKTVRVLEKIRLLERLAGVDELTALLKAEDS